MSDGSNLTAVSCRARNGKSIGIINCCMRGSFPIAPVNSHIGLTCFTPAVYVCSLQCFDAVGWAAGRASGL